MSWFLSIRSGLLTTWQLEHHRVREYKDRLAIERWDGERLTWEEVQAVKERVWGDVFAIELYPTKDETVNLRHTRHIWRFAPYEVLEDMVRQHCQHPEFHYTQKRAS